MTIWQVLSIPAEHPYTRAVKPDSVEYLPDPDINGNWWPHPALEAEYWNTPPRADILHIHFGFEHRTPEQIEQLVDKLPVPLVVTVHDLDNPHLTDQTEHHQRLQTLVDASAAVITLTDCAAERLRRQFHTESTVIPHPPIASGRESSHGGGAGVFLKSLRSNVVADAGFYANLGPVTVYIHDVEKTRDLREELKRLDNVTLVEHAPMGDGELHEAVGKLDVCVLPYTRGTHSGWLQMCRDLGVNVAVPDIGCYAGQADTPEAVAVYEMGDGASAAEAVDKLRRPVPYAGGASTDDIKRAHHAIYEAVVR